MKNDKKILVIGSINMDLIMSLPRVPEAGESLFAKDYMESPGGKGSNQAIAVSRLGGNVSYIGKVGNDEYGSRLKESLESFNVKTDNLLIAEGANTGRALILLEENGQNRIIVLKGANDLLTPEDIKNQLDQTRYDIILLQLEIPLSTVEFIIEYARSLGIPVVVDAGPAVDVDINIFKKVDVLSPNQTEIFQLTGQRAETIEEAKIACRKLREATGAGMIILKMGDQGALLYDDNGYQFFESYQIEVKDTTAAGDAFSAALTVGLAEGWPIEKTMCFANATGALAVSKLGAHSSMPTLEEVKQFLKENKVDL